MGYLAYKSKETSLDEPTHNVEKYHLDSDGKFVLDNIGNKVLDRYLDIPVEIDNMAIFPGSVIILDNNELSVSRFIEEFGDVF